jgi:hypothetical protein
MHGPTCVCWANLTPLSLQIREAQAALQAQAAREAAREKEEENRERERRVCIVQFWSVYNDQ